MNYLYVQIDGQDHVCVHKANDPVAVKPATDGMGMAYNQTQIRIEQKRLNDHLEAKGISDYSISIQSIIDNSQRQD
jgi:hypothetical protein